MLRAAGCGIAFQPKTAAVAEAAQHIVHGDLAGVLQVLEAEILARSA
jgi:phosphoserine phosphatase